MIADIKLSDKIFRQFQKSLGDFGNEEVQSFDWRYNEFSSYVVLDGNADPDELSGKMERYKEFITMENKDQLHFRLQPVSEIYLGSQDINGSWLPEAGKSGRIEIL